MIHDILLRYANDVHWKTKPIAASLGNCPSRLTGRHFPVVLTGAPEGTEGASKKQRKCRFCSLTKKTKRMIYSCDQCMVPLCITPCFKEYHVVKTLPQSNVDASRDE